MMTVERGGLAEAVWHETLAREHLDTCVALVTTFERSAAGEVVAAHFLDAGVSIVAAVDALKRAHVGGEELDRIAPIQARLSMLAADKWLHLAKAHAMEICDDDERQRWYRAIADVTAASGFWFEVEEHRRGLTREEATTRDDVLTLVEGFELLIGAPLA